MLYFELIFELGVRLQSRFIFDDPNWHNTLYGKAIILPLNYFCTFVKNQLDMLVYNL